MWMASGENNAPVKIGVRDHVLEIAAPPAVLR